MTSRMMMISEE